MTIIDLIQILADKIEMFANLFIVVAVCKYAYSEQRVDIVLSCGSFRMKRKDITLQNVTGVVSQLYFDGAWLPDEIRKEILVLTNPRATDVVSYNYTVKKGTPPPQK